MNLTQQIAASIALFPFTIVSMLFFWFAIESLNDPRVDTILYRAVTALASPFVMLALWITIWA